MYLGIPQRDLSRIGHALDVNRVPYVVGWSASSVLWGVPLDLSVTQFVIPDEHFTASINVITNAGYEPCTDTSCPIVQESNTMQIPDAHVHITYNGWSTISVYKKSLIFWALPEFPIQPPAVDDRHFILSNDPRLSNPCGTWAPQFPPVKILTGVALFEALILLMCRDMDHVNDLYSTWIGYVLRLLIHRGRPWVKVQDLQPQFHPYWRLRTEEPHPPRVGWAVAQLDALRGLRKSLEGTMPPPSDTVAPRGKYFVEINRKYGYV